MDVAQQWLDRIYQTARELPGYVWAAAAGLVVLAVLLRRLRRRRLVQRCKSLQTERRLVGLN
jgi:hypothetical protein